MIYLDYQASTPLAPEARTAMLSWLGDDSAANPHSAHAQGRRARAAIEVARDQIAMLMPRGGAVVFTSGATEAANIALRGCAVASLALPMTEHACVLDTALMQKRQGSDVRILLPDDQGLVTGALAEVDLVAVMLVNNEIGVVQPIAELAASVPEALVLCDAVQGYGRVPIPECCDMVVISAHKIHGPKGIGALWVREGVLLTPLATGGGQEAGLRPGTLSPALCAGFGAAARLMAERADEDRAHVGRLWALALECLGPGWTINGSTEARWFGNLNIRRDGLDAARLVSELRDIAFSTGSACASGSGRTSHVLTAIGLTGAQARSSVRLGFGRYTTEAEIRAAFTAIAAAAARQCDPA